MTPSAKKTRIYKGKYLRHVAFPMGGIGAGMICLDGNGGFSHISIANRPEMFNEPCIFSAICIKGEKNQARVLEGPVSMHKVFGVPGAGNGGGGRKPIGLPRFSEATFHSRFPFGFVQLQDSNLPITVTITGWSPFIPGDADKSSLPVTGIEYEFFNLSNEKIDLVFSFNSTNFIGRNNQRGVLKPLEHSAVKASDKGLLFQRLNQDDHSKIEGTFAATLPEENVYLNATLFRGGWFDSLTMAWNDIRNGALHDNPAADDSSPSPGGAISSPFSLQPGEKRTLKLQFAWYVPESTIRLGQDEEGGENACDCQTGADKYQPWYVSQFKNVEEIVSHWQKTYDELKTLSQQFSDCFYDTDLPAEIVDAVAANLTILKSPTVLRQTDGRLWAWEGCRDNEGCCAGSCTHVWNYAQAIPHLFPELERTLRDAEFNESQDDTGHQTFRTGLPIRPIVHQLKAAADGQLGGIMKVYREWRISGNDDWLRDFWPKVRAGLDYCIETWDPEQKGALFEPHHNTYDIEFWGPNGMCTSFYLGALKAAVLMGQALSDDVSRYQTLFEKGKVYLENELYDGEYFIQKVMREELKLGKPTEETREFEKKFLSPEEYELLLKEGPKYQYGSGCLSDGVLGDWIAEVCGVGEIIDRNKLRSHLKSVYKYNFRKNLIDHANPQRPTFALGNEGGLLLCSWPKGGEPSLPFVYSNEVWTGIEYQVASHLMMQGMVKHGLKIVKTLRKRYNGEHRNPFNEVECGHWYARAMASYGLLQGITGIRYDAVEKTLYIQPGIKGDFRCFLSTASGYGTAGIRKGKPFVEVKWGSIQIDRIEYQKLK